MNATEVLKGSLRPAGRVITTPRLFVLLILSNILVVMLFDKLILTKDMYHTLFSARMEETRIDEFIDLLSKAAYVKYSVMPLIIFIKIVFITSLLQLPLLLMNTEISYHEIFRMVTLANFVYIVLAIVKIIMIKESAFGSVTPETLSINPLAVTNIVDCNAYSVEAFTLLNTVNVFEICWIGILIRAMTRSQKVSLIDASIDVVSVWAALCFGQYAIIYSLTRLF